MKPTRRQNLIAAALLALAGCSSTSDNQPSPAAANARAGVVTQTRTKTSTVESIDASTLTVMLRNPDGSVTGYLCRPEVRNFNQIKVGDKVTFTVTEETAVSFGRGVGPPGAPAPTTYERASLGEKPGGTLVDAVEFTGKVVSVDTKNCEVTVLTGAAGVLKTLKVSSNIDLAKVKPGEDVGVRVTQTSVIAVETP